MSIFVKATSALPARTNTALQMALVYAALLTIMAVTQLFTLEEFIPAIQAIDLPLNETGRYLAGPLVIVAEIFALPFLLRMRLSSAMRWVSMGLGVFAALAWFGISTFALSQDASLGTVGFLGGLVHLVPGWWALPLSGALLILSLWSSWGLWPGKRK